MNKKDTLSERMQSAMRLRQIRENVNLTQEQFSEILGVSPSAYKKVESGENQVSIACLKKLNKAMNVASDYVLYGDNQNLDDTWRMILNCSETDKFYLLMKLLIYFIKIKEPIYQLKDSQVNEDKDIIQLLHRLLNEGES